MNAHTTYINDKGEGMERRLTAAERKLNQKCINLIEDVKKNKYNDDRIVVKINTLLDQVEKEQAGPEPLTRSSILQNMQKMFVHRMDDPSRLLDVFVGRYNEIIPPIR